MRFFKRMLILAFVCALLYGGSYVGARARAGMFIGSPAPPMGEREQRFVWDGVQELPAHPRAWEITYARPGINQNRPVKIFVSPTGKVLGTIPRDLDRRVEAYRRSREVQ
jgi:hypothetical protein